MHESERKSRLLGLVRDLDSIRNHYLGIEKVDTQFAKFRRCKLYRHRYVSASRADEDQTGRRRIGYECRRRKSCFVIEENGVEAGCLAATKRQRSAWDGKRVVLE